MKLEYRGYDSAGIATLEDGTPTVVKNTVRVRNLYQDPQLDALTGTVGIAHTRWATHGKPSKENSHPQMCIRDSACIARAVAALEEKGGATPVAAEAEEAPAEADVYKRQPHRRLPHIKDHDRLGKAGGKRPALFGGAGLPGQWI